VRLTDNSLIFIREEQVPKQGLQIMENGWEAFQQEIELPTGKTLKY